jgi:hypothetical protein
LTPPVKVEVVVDLGVLRETEILDLVPERLLRLDISIFLSSADMFASAVFPSIPASARIDITWSGVLFSSLDKLSTVCAILIAFKFYCVDPFISIILIKPSFIFSGCHNNS